MNSTLLIFQEREAFERAKSSLASKSEYAIESYSSYEINDSQEPERMDRLAWTSVAGLVGAASGLVIAFGVQAYESVIDAALDIGGRPLFSWPAFIPITFVLTVLGAGTAIFIAFLFLNRLPEPYHPVFESEHFSLASDQYAIRVCYQPKPFQSAAEFTPDESKQLAQHYQANLVEIIP